MRLRMPEKQTSSRYVWWRNLHWPAIFDHIAVLAHCLSRLWEMGCFCLVSVARSSNHQSTTSSPAASSLCTSKISLFSTLTPPNRTAHQPLPSCASRNQSACAQYTWIPLAATHNDDTNSRSHENVQLHRIQGWFQLTVLWRVAASSTNQCSDWHACRYGPMCLKEGGRSTYWQTFSEWWMISSALSRHNRNN